MLKDYTVTLEAFLQEDFEVVAEDRINAVEIARKQFKQMHPVDDYLIDVSGVEEN